MVRQAALHDELRFTPYHCDDPRKAAEPSQAIHASDTASVPTFRVGSGATEPFETFTLLCCTLMSLFMRIKILAILYKRVAQRLITISTKAILLLVLMHLTTQFTSSMVSPLWQRRISTMNQHFVPRLDHFEFYSALDTTQTAYSPSTPRPTRKLLDTATGEFITPTMTTPTETQPNDGIVAKLAVGEFASGTVAASVTDSPEPPLLAMAWLIARLTTIPALIFMQAGGGPRRGQMARVPDPPSYDPANERREPFRLYTQRLMIWAILAADLDPGQQCASIINMLRGDAQVLGLQLSYADITQGAMVNGVQVDPVTSLLSQLAAAFAPLGEEARIQAMSEIMNFHRQGANETTDALIQRFKMLKWRAAQGNAGINMTWEGYTWLLLKAVGLSQSTLIQVLQPFQGRFPNVEAEFDQMCMALRRLGHIYENTPHNIAHALHTPPGRMFPVFNGGSIPSTGGLAFPVGQPDPWNQPGGDPWGGGFGAGNAFAAAPTAAPPSNASNPFVSYEQQQYQAYPVQQPNSDDGYITGTDSDTESSFGEDINYDSAEFAGLTPHQIGEKIWWGYARGKSLWRRHTHKPVRKVRRFIKRKGGGKGRSKGKGRYLCLEQLPDSQISQVFFGGGKSGGKRTTGKGKGRKKNPTGPDGAVMTCSICGSEDHFRAACPRGASGSAHLCQPTGSFSGFWAVGTDSPAIAATPKATGPLADILFHNAVDTTAFTTMLIGEVDTTAMDAVNTTAPFHVPELPLPYAETAFFRDPFPASSPGPNLLQEHILEMNTQWTGNAYGTAAEQREGTLDDEVQLQFNETLRDRYLTVERAVAAATHPPPKAIAPMPTRDFQTEFPGFGAFGDQGRQYRQQLLERRANLTGPAAKAAAWATGTAPPHVPPTWSGEARGPGVSSNAAYPQQEASHAEQPPAMAAFAKHGLQARPFHEDLARARRQGAARELANLMQGTTTGSGRPAMTDDGSHCCTICMETYQPTDQVSYLACTHHFHIGCIDTWCAMQLLRNGINEVLGCPLCRQEISVSNILEAYGLPSAVDDFLDAHNDLNFSSGSSSRSSVAQGAFPIFPARLGVHNNDTVTSESYLTTSTLKDRLALIIDTGAFTSITGATLARSLAMAAKKNGVPVEQVKLDKPMKIGGVGQGTETCNYALKTTLAVEHIGDGASHLHEWTAPIVEGNGEHLPGLLGMDSLEKNRAIIDAGRGRLIYPGPGEVQIILPPGSIEMPIVKSSSGHPCIVVDEYAKLITAKVGGLQEPTPTLTVTKPTTEPARKRDLLQSRTHTVRPSQHNLRVLVVEEQPIASILFAEEGYTVEKRSHAEMIDTEAMHVNGDIKKSKYSAVWLTLPATSKVPRHKAAHCSKTLALWFRTAAMMGISAFMLGPRCLSWSEPSVAALLTDQVGTMSIHQMCRFAENYTEDSKLPSDGSYCIISNKYVDGHPCTCNSGTPHCKDYNDIGGRPYAAARRSIVNFNMVTHLFDHTKPFWTVSAKISKKPVFYDEERWQEETRLLSLPSLPTQVEAYPTESAVKAKEKQKANKLAGIKPKRKPVHVEEHYDDLGDDMSGLGDDLTFLAADITPSDWTDDESDSDAEAIVLKWTKPGMYLPCFAEAMKLPALNSMEIELAEVSVSPRGWPEMLFSIRKHSQSQHQLNVSTTVQTQDPTEHNSFIDYFRTRPVLTLVMTSPRSPVNAAKQAYVTLLGQLATVQNNSGKAFIALFENKDEALYNETWRQLAQQRHIEANICHDCQLAHNKTSKHFKYEKRPFFVITNKIVIAKQFKNMLCPGTHNHAQQDGPPRFALCQWPTGLLQKVDMGIVDLIVEGKRTMFASGTVAASVTDSPELGRVFKTNLFQRHVFACHGCKEKHAKGMRTHNRESDCKFKNLPEIEWEPNWTCPGCSHKGKNGNLIGKPRGHPWHKYDDTCRLTTIVPRNTSKHPREAPIPIGRDSSGNASAPDIPEVELPPDQTSGPSSGSTDVQAEPKATRGPDLQERFPEVPKSIDEVNTDWSKFNIDKSLRILRNGTDEQQKLEVRKLHLRWWHAPRAAMEKIFNAASLPQSVIALVPHIIQTCRACRAWALSGPDVTPSVELVDKQNVEVEADILFYKLFKVWHMIDRADRWHAAMEIQTKEATELQQAIDKTWLRHFGPFKVLVIDGEKGIDSIATKEWLQRHGIELRIRAKGQHARMIERRGAILRHCMHTTEEQLEKEGITVTFDELLSTAVLSGNALTNVGGGTPYQARLGSTPAILPDMMIPQERGTTIGGLERMRTIALEKIVAATAIARINRASGSMTTASGEAHAYEPGELIDFHTPASQADVSNWQGPATVIENKPSEGLVKFKWKAQNMSRRYAEVRRFMDFTAVVFGYLATPSTSAGGAAKCLLTTLSHMRENSIVTVGFVKQSDTWIPTQLHNTHKHVAYAVEFLVKNVFHATGVVAAKLGKAVSTFKSFKGATASKLLWWNSKVGFDNMQSADMFDTSGYHTKNIVGDDWQKQNYLQLLLAPNAGIDLSALLDPEIGNIDHSTSGKSDDANASGRTSAVDPDQLSRIDEGDEGDDAPEWFANDVWLTCTPEQKAVIKDIEAEANDPEIAVDMEEDYINQAKEMFSDSLNLEAEVFSSGTVAASVTDSPEPPGNTTVVAITWPDQDEHGNMYVSIPFLGDAAKLITMEPVPEKHQAEIRAYLKTNASQVFIEVEDEPVIDGGKSYDDLTSSDYKQHSDKVNEAVHAELKTWIDHDCFEMIPRMGARNILDLRWVGKWKKLKHPTDPGKFIWGIRMRMTQRGFKDEQADKLKTFSGTSSRLSQRVVVSECCCRKWKMATLDVKKAFLKGVTYEELADLSGEPLREVNFEITEEVARILRRFPGYEKFDRRKHILRNKKPGTGTKDAPRCFAIKLKRATHGRFGAKSTTHDPQLIVKHEHGKCVMIGTIHVDDIKIAWGDDKVFDMLIEALEFIFGKGEIEITMTNFACCGVQYTKVPDGYTMDQINYVKAIKPIEGAHVTGKPDDELAPPTTAHEYLSVLMSLAYALLTRFDIEVYMIALQKFLQKPKFIHIRRLNTLVRWTQKHPKTLKYPHMVCAKLLEVHSDTGFRREVTEEGDVDGRALKGINFLRLGQSNCTGGTNFEVQCHFLDCIVGCVKVVVRSTFTAETHGVIGGADGAIGLALTLHEIEFGPVTLKEAMNLTDFHGLGFKIDCVTDARNLLLILKNVNMKNPAEKNFIVHLLWLKNKLENGVINSLIWTDTRDMTADGHTKGTIKRTALHLLMTGTLKITHARERLTLFVPHAKIHSSIGYLQALCVFDVNTSHTPMASSSSTPAWVPMQPQAKHTEKARPENMAEPVASTGEFASGTVAASVTDSPEPPVGSSQQSPAVETPHDDDILLSSDDGDDDDDWFENDAGYILRAEDNPWKALHMNTITYDHACIQHPKEIDKAFKALLRKYHPDKCRNEMQLQENTTKTRIIIAARKFLTVPVGEDGMPLDTEQQRARADKARECFDRHDPLHEPKAGYHTSTASELCVLNGQRMLQGALMQAYCQRARKSQVKKSTIVKTNSEADRQLAVVQRDCLMTFNQRTWQIPKNMTSEVAIYKAKKEIFNAAVKTHIKMKLARYRLLNAKLKRDGKLPTYTNRQLNKAAIKWKRAAQYKIKQVKDAAIRRRKAVIGKNYRPPSFKRIYQAFVRGTHSFTTRRDYSPDEAAAYKTKTHKRRAELRNEQRRRTSLKRSLLQDKLASIAGAEAKAKPPIFKHWEVVKSAGDKKTRRGKKRNHPDNSQRLAMPDEDAERSLRRDEHMQGRAEAEVAATPLHMHTPEDNTEPDKTVYCIRCAELYRVKTPAMLESQTVSAARNSSANPAVRELNLPFCFVCKMNRQLEDEKRLGKWHHEKHGVWSKKSTMSVEAHEALFDAQQAITISKDQKIGNYESDDEVAPSTFQDALNSAAADQKISEYDKFRCKSSPLQNPDCSSDDEHTKEGLLGVRPSFAWKGRKAPTWRPDQRGSEPAAAASSDAAAATAGEFASGTVAASVTDSPEPPAGGTHDETDRDHSMWIGNQQSLESQSAVLKNRLLRSNLFKQPAGTDQADEIIVEEVMKAAAELSATTDAAAPAEVINTEEQPEDDVSSDIHTMSSGFDSCGDSSSDSPTDEDYMAEDLDPFDIKETENDLQCDPKGIEKFDDFIINVVLSDTDEEPPMKGSVLTSSEEAAHAACSDVAVQTAWLKKRNSYLQRLTCKSEEKKKAKSQMNVIRKKAALDRHMIQLSMLQGADELVSRSNVEASFKRSKFDPFHYEAVVTEILERNKIRDEEERAEFAHGSNIPTEVQTAHAVESEARAVLRDPTLALPSAEDEEDIDFAAVVDEAMAITRCCICTKRVASHVCNVCRIDGFCDFCFKANRMQIMQLYRYLKFCDLCKKSHHTSCGDTVKSGRSRCHICSTSEHKHENPKYAFKRAPWRNKISDEYLNKDASDSSRPKPKDYWADDRIGATTGRWSTAVTQDSSTFLSDARGSDEPCDSSTNPWLILDDSDRVITAKARPPLKFPVPSRTIDRPANPQ